MRGLNITGSVEKVKGDEMSYSEFIEKYLSKNKPVVITGIMDDWKACKDWVLTSNDDDGAKTTPNLDFISSNFGTSKVQDIRTGQIIGRGTERGGLYYVDEVNSSGNVMLAHGTSEREAWLWHRRLGHPSVADCGSREFQRRFDMSVAEFIDHWRKLSSVEHRNHSTNELKGNTLLYLKDWHFVKEYPEYTAYTTPLFFHDDWLNLYLDRYHMHQNPDTYQKRDDISSSDYRFVYMGAKGTWTPFHADVFRSYSWSANVCGKKQWYFLSPDQCHLAFDRNMKSSVYDIFEEVSETIFPNFKKTLWLECTQDKNEIIYVPSGWYHQVHNLEDTISINHNWFNAYNLSWVWDLLSKDYKEAVEYIEDIKDICDDFEGLCQRNLAANTGMNFYDFFTFMVRYSFANIVQLLHLARRTTFGNQCSSHKAQHLIFNLKSAKDIAIKMKLTCLSENHNILLDFKSILEESTFLELCSQLEITYDSIHYQHTPIVDTKKYLTEDLVDPGLCKLFSTVICNPENLAILIDDTLQYLKHSFV